METVNTKLKDGVYVPVTESVTMDPFSEFEYVDDRHHEQDEVTVLQQPQQQTSQNPLDGLTKNIDQFFDGVDMFFNLANQVQRRINGGPNVRRRRRF